MGDAYFRPTSLDEALAALAEGGWRIAAGCTDLFPATERKALDGPVLDITRIEGLRGIEPAGAGLRIGAATTWTDIARADLPPACRGLQLAAREVGALQIQNRGTIGGNLCNASPAADGVPPLMTLDAEVELRSAAGARRMALAEFLTGPRRTGLGAGEMMTAVHIPSAEGRGAFQKLGARRYLVISIVMTAARIVERDGAVTEAALSVGACGPVAARLREAEAALIGAPLDPSRIEDGMVAAALSPIDDMRADAAYRAQAAAELMRRTLGDLMERRDAA